MYFNKKFITITSLLIGTLMVHTSNGLTLQQKEIDLKKQEDFVKIQESLKPIKCNGVNESLTFAPESQVVGIYFNKDIVEFNIPSDSFKNKTKQSQEFEIDKPNQLIELIPTTTTTSSSSSSSISESNLSGSQTNETPDIIQVSSTTTTTPSSPSEPSIVVTQEPITISTTISSNSSDEQIPVASMTTRKGDAVRCGEANPNGKSNKKLVLDRIVGGRKTEPGEFPFQVRLNIRSRRGSGICGGVILNERYILTAAHCMTACVSHYLTTATIETTGVHATIGDHSIKSNDGEVEIDIEKIIPHEKYDACNFYANDHDIALIRTSTPIEYRFTSDGYGSINRPCMPISEGLTYKDGESVIVSGWGVTRENSGSLSNILRYVQVPVVNISKCQETYGNRVTNDHICAGFQSGGKDSCQGDSGGPLVRVVENKYELVGIVSFGYGCGQPSAPGVYTRVASYINWIQSNI